MPSIRWHMFAALLRLEHVVWLCAFDEPPSIATLPMNCV